jgi:hypothetical protein
MRRSLKLKSSFASTALAVILLPLASSLIPQTSYAQTSLGQSAQSKASSRQALQTQAAAPSGAQALGRLPATQQLDLAISLPLRNQDQLTIFLQQLEDPASANYHHFLSVQQFADQFSPSVVDQQRVIGYAQAYGLKVTHTFANRLVIDVHGTVADVERAFQVRMNVYRHPTENRTFYAPDAEPSVEAGLPVLSIDGLSTFALPQSMLKKALPGTKAHSEQTGSGPGGEFLGSDIRTAYGGGTTLDGSGQVVGLIEIGPYRLADVISYFASIGQPLNVPIVNVLVGVDGVCDATEPPSNPQTPCDDGEEAIDIQQAIAMAPNLSALIVYEAYGPSVDALNAYAQAASDNLAKQLSISFGWGGTPGTESGYEQVFEELEAQGQSSFVASGDAGASLSGGYPGNSTNITDAGGTDITTASAGGAWLSETGWIGSGGGWNTAVAIPSWQLPVINATNGGDASYRNIPDVSAEANTDNYFCANGSCQGGIGGTSLAAPRWAGFVALINQQAAANATSGANPPLGFLNPTIYTLGQGASYADVFHDITAGNNETSTPCTNGTPGCLNGDVGFNAVAGFDLVTGWGSPNGPTAFTTLFPTTSNPNFSMSATPSVLPLTAGIGASSSIAVTALNGFNAVTNLAVVIPGSGTPSYAPAGLTATLGASSIPAGGVPVMLNVSTTAPTPGGTYVIAIVGTSGTLTQTAYVTVQLPAFAGLNATPAAGVSVNQGGTANATVTSTVINGFNSAINLSASGLPTGVTASFTAVNATTTTVTFTASSNAALTGSGKPTEVIITGAAGSTSLSTQINLFVNPAQTGGAGTPVNLSSVFNVYAFYDDADESTITQSNSLDGVGFAFSANLLGTSLNDAGTQFTFGPANQPDAVYGTGSSIPLPTGTFGTLQLLATGIEGNQASQPVTVTYADSTTSNFTQSFSDWCSALNGNGCVSTGSNSGESVAVAMPYRDSSTGPDDRVFYLYHYSFALNTNVSVQSLTLPNNRDVIVLAATLTPVVSYSLSAGAPTQTSVSPGGSSQATITVASTNGYTGSVTLSCGVSPVVTNGPTCSFGNTSPVTVTGSGGTATVTFNTASANSAALPKAPGAGRWYALFFPVPALVLCGVLGAPRSRRNLLLSLALLWIVLAGIMIIPACGGCSSSNGSCSSGGGGGGGTPAGPYVITITGKDANGVTQTNTPPTVTINVT